MKKPINLLGLAVLGMLAGGCIMSPHYPGGRGTYQPNQPGYAQYLAECRQVSPVLEARCRQWGEPIVVKAGATGGIFCWQNNNIGWKVGPFGYTHQVVITRRNKELWNIIFPGSIPYPIPGPIPDPIKLYSIISFVRNPQEDFAYTFQLKLIKPNTTVSEIQSVKDEMRRAVERDYRATFKEDLHLMNVDFPKFEVKDQIIEGRAELSQCRVVSFTYDARTNKGMIGVKIGASSFDAARKWVRSNIETIVRDKNIALVTGKVPLDRKFMTHSETVRDGNVLEIVFEVL